jgi:hypothetical protein
MAANFSVLKGNLGVVLYIHFYQRGYGEKNFHLLSFSALFTGRRAKR